MRFDLTTLALQTINLLVLLWLLRRFLFRPVVEVIARRKAAAETLLADAAAARAQAAQEADTAQRDRSGIAGERIRVMAEAHVAAEAERAAVLAAAKAEAEQTRAAMLADLAQQRRAMQTALTGEAAHLAVGIAARLLGRVAAPAIDLALLQSTEARLRALSDAERAALAPPDATLTVATATPLDAPGAAAWTEMLRRVLPTVAPPRFADDRSLIGGVELRGPNGRLRNNWRADLDGIAGQLGRDDERVVA